MKWYSLDSKRLFDNLGAQIGELVPFMNVSWMLLLGSVCRMGVYTLLTVAATMEGVVIVATHQIALQVPSSALVHVSVHPQLTKVQDFRLRSNVRKIKADHQHHKVHMLRQTYP